MDNTPRQELISHAAAKLRLLRQNKSYWHNGKQPQPADAVEAVLDGARPGTLGGAMLAYLQSISDSVRALNRLDNEIERMTK